MSAERFIHFATEGRRDLADAEPVPADDRWVRLVRGEGWDGDANEVGGPRGWAPLHYVCHSVYAPVDLARALLERGADPNAYFANDFGPMSALYGAAGVLHDAELTRLLLEHGADPNGEPHFGDALYHAAGAPGTACLEALLAAGARPRGSGALGLALDDERPEHVRRLLAAGADPGEAAYLVHAVRRGRSAATIERLIEAGAELDARGGEWSTPEAEYRTAYENAALRGRRDVMEALAAAGASTAVSEEDEAVAAAARGEPAVLPEVLHADQQEVLADAALNGFVDEVVAALGTGRRLHNGGGPPGTLLHMAAWVGDAALVERLLELGADPLAGSGAEFGTPLAWVVHGSQYGEGRGGRVEGAERLLAAGAELEPRFADTARGTLRDWLGRAERHM